MPDEKTKSQSATLDAPPAPGHVRITFMPEGRTVEYEHGKLDYKDHGKPESILDIALNHGVFLDHACGGNCACTTCHVWVRKGAEHLTDLDDDEADRLDMPADLQRRSQSVDGRQAGGDPDGLV